MRREDCFISVPLASQAVTTCLLVNALTRDRRCIHAGFISHSYPHCWRCRSGLIFRATEQWFFSLNKNETFARFLIAKVSRS
jgi:isoleucyl-tRNA synthetase